MLLPILSAIWFGYRASRVGRNTIAWAALGFGCWLVIKVGATLLLYAMFEGRASVDQSEATGAAILLNVLGIGAIAALGSAIPPKKGAQQVGPTGPAPAAPLAGSGSDESLHHPLILAVRGAIGGTLMGLANLVPGISGGTMLLAAGVYPGFIEGIAEVTTLRFRTRSLILLASVAGTAALAILLLAGTVKGLVQDHRWVMYSLFIGLTLGGVPLIWRMARPATPALLAGASAAFAVMLMMALTGGAASAAGERNLPLLFVAGLAGSSAMILPGVSGGYLLLLLGQYEPILGTIDQLKIGLLGNPTTGAGADLALVLDALWVVVPVGIGIVCGIVGVSNLLRWLLHRYEKVTLGALLGLLLGAVVGLFPFQEGRPPQPGDVVKGRVVTAESAPEIEVDHWPVVRFQPTAGQVGASLALILAGIAATSLLGRLGGDDEDAQPAA